MKPKSIFILSEYSFENIYSPEQLARIQELTDVIPTRLCHDTWQEHKNLLADVEYVFSGWGMALMDEAFLLACPKLRHVFYGAGSIRKFYTDAAQERGVGISSSWRANAVPVAEFSHAAIILSLKHFWPTTRRQKAERTWQRDLTLPGAYGSTVGLVSLGEIGRMVAERLKAHQIKVIAYDPFCAGEQAQALGVKLVDLETLFSTADVISLHTPSLPETQKMITQSLLERMKQGATLINTSRGAVIDEDALATVLRQRTDLEALLDVTTDEPTPSDHPFWDLANVHLTPHIAGSVGNECQRMGGYMVEECERLLSGRPLQHEVTAQALKTMA